MDSKRANGSFDEEMRRMLSDYKRDVTATLLSSFGLEMLMQKHGLRDQEGGEVDTAHNLHLKHGEAVNVKDADLRAEYKRLMDENPYRYADYHKEHSNYDSMKYEDWRRYNESGGEPGVDGYTGERNLGPGVNNKYPTSAGQAPRSVDHVVSSHEIHEDPVRVLAGVDGNELCDGEWNLIMTNQSLNSSKGDLSVEEFLRTPEGQSLDASTRERMREADRKAREELAKQTDKGFYEKHGVVVLRNAATSALKAGATMALRQTVGMVLAEVWWAVSEAVEGCARNMRALAKAVADGLKRGLKRAKERFASFFAQSALGGILSSLVTTLINMFLTTGKALVRVLREAGQAVVGMFRVLFINPDRLPLGERVKAALKILSLTGGVIAGFLSAEALGKAGLDGVPFAAEIKAVLGAVIGGAVGIGLSLLLCANPLVQRFFDFLSSLPSVQRTTEMLRQQGQELEAFLKELLNYDIEGYEREVQRYGQAVSDLNSSDSTEVMSRKLDGAMQRLGLLTAWQQQGYASAAAWLGDPNAKAW